MTIHELRILPPLAIARLGSSPEPLANYDLLIGDDPLGFREVVPAETLLVDRETGAVTGSVVHGEVRFKDEVGRIHPVAPFLEVWVLTAEGGLEPLTLDLLAAVGAAAADISWRVQVGNIKAYRRTGDPHDRIEAVAGPFSDHRQHQLCGRCDNFKPERVLPLGWVQYLQPSAEFPALRLRFTPAEGAVYGPEVDDNVLVGRDVYDAGKGGWKGYADSGAVIETIPGGIYAGDDDAAGNFVSRGYLDDECDGFVEARLTLGEATLTAFARIGAGPPTFAPDSYPPRTVADELEQALLGPEVAAADLSSEAAEEIVRRAFETVRLMQTEVMNGNVYDGRINVASTMVSQDTNDTGRLFEPIMAPSLVDSLTLLGLHQSVLAALRSGTAPWFADVLRRHDEIGDLSSTGRRKMPALMRGADGRHLTLTRRQVSTVEKTATRHLFADRAADQEGEPRDE